MRKRKTKKLGTKQRRSQNGAKRPLYIQDVDLFGEPITDARYERPYWADDPAIAWGRCSPYGD
jgi:hypothetical protein